MYNMNEDKMRLIVNDLYLFYRYFVASSFKQNLPAKHIKEISRELMRMYRGDYQRLCVAQPPRTSKSSLITLAYPFWLIIRNPSLNILIVNNSASLSEKFGIQLRELFNKYGELFNVRLSDIKHSSTYLMFTDNNGKLHSGSIRLVGAGGSITGQDVDVCVIDDPYNGYNDVTPTLLQKKIDWFNTLILQRLEPHSRLLILHTKWHSNDLQSYLKKEDEKKPLDEREYRFLSYPAINDDGTCIWPERYTVKDFERKREAMGERLFQAIYQQKPLDDTSDFFDMGKMHWYRPDMEILQPVRGYDIASSDPGKNDFTAGVPIYLLDDGKSILITDYLYGQFGKNTKNTVKDQVQFDGHDNISIIETGVAAAGKILFDEWEEQLMGYFVERGEAVPNNSKADRATPLKNHISDGYVYVDIADDKLRQIFIDEFKAFPNGQHDDIVDASAHGFNYLKKNYIGDVVFEIVDL